MRHKNSLLIVEDEVLVARDIKCRLGKMGYDVAGIACRGHQAVKMALAMRPDLILMDINLRDDLDGVEAAMQIRDVYDVPIIFCTAYSNQETLERVKRAEPYGYVLKPFDNRELEIHIEMALYKHRMDRESRDAGNRLAVTLTSLNEGVIATDLTGEVFVINPVAEALSGWTRATLKGLNIAEVMNLRPLDENEAEADFCGLFERHVAIQPVRQLVTAADGRELPVELSACVVEDAPAGMVVISIRDISGQLDHEEKIRRVALFDDLTDLPSKTLFLDRLGSSLNRRKRGDKQAFAVVLVGLDGFTLINESLGRDHGDRLIREMGERIRQAVRPGDAVSRFDGDTFGVLLDPVDSVRGAIQACSRVQGAIEKPFRFGGTTVNMTATAGIVMHRQGLDESPEVVLRDADTALHRAKLDAKGAYVVFDNEMYEKALKFVAWENGIQRAIQEDALEVHYQPIVSIETKRLVSMEAFVRWPHPELGLVPPSEFLPIAEESGLIVSLGEWVLRAVCAQIRVWGECGFNNVRVAVNLSPRQFEADVPKLVRGVLRESGISPESLGLEITEDLAMKNVDQNMGKLRELNALGLNISIDDFGTGSSSLAYLKRMPLHTLKIDRSFIVDLVTNEDDRAVTRAIIAMGHNLRLKVLAEGVENAGQVEILRDSGCDYIQGYYHTRPLPGSEVLPFLKLNRMA